MWNVLQVYVEYIQYLFMRVIMDIKQFIWQYTIVQIAIGIYIGVIIGVLVKLLIIKNA